MQKSMNYRRVALLLSIGLFVIALTQKSYCTTQSCGDSLAVFISGVAGIFFGGAGLCWLANPLVFFSWLFIKKNKASLLLSSISFLIAISFLFFDEIIVTEAGHYAEITEYRLGYWLWISSILVMIIGNLLIRMVSIFSSPTHNNSLGQ